MYIVRWLTHHPILAVWILTIIALLLSMGGSGGQKHETDAPSSAQHANETTEVKGHDADEAQAEDAKTNDEASAHAAADVQQASEQVIDQTADENVVKTAENNESQQKVVENTVESNAGSAAGVATQAQSATETAVAVGAEQQQAAVVNNEEATTATSESDAAVPPAGGQETSLAGLDEKSTEDLLLMAREAYWNNGLEEAATIYGKLIEREPEVIEYKGELGNVYWRQGFPEKSANLYAEIAIPMIHKGDGERVSNMIGFIGLFFPEKASEISKHLESTKN